MKNQYFGDIRDRFKYDLIQEIMQRTPGFKQYTFIPMLTMNDTRTDGNKRRIDERRMNYRPGSQNFELIEYLEKCSTSNPEDRDFREIRDFFTRKGIHIVICGPDVCCRDDCFTHKKRHGYFSSIPDQALESALVFVDPDNGLEVISPSQKHLLYSEVNMLLERMSEDSILMIYQHFPRENHDLYISRRMEELRDKTNTNPLWVTDDEVVFFFVGKSNKTLAGLKGVLSGYSSRYAKCRAIF